MPKNNKNRNSYKNRNYRVKKFGKSVLDDNPTLILTRYWTPKTYLQPVKDVIFAFKSGIPFNRAVDQVHALDPNHLNRNKLHEHALKTIANDY